MMKIVEVNRAAIIPFHVDEQGTERMMFMRPSNPKYGGDKFQIAKGRIEEGESSKECAIREGGEELGLREENIRMVGDCGVVLGKTHLFVALVHDMESFNPFDEETGGVIWMTLEEFLLDGRELHHDSVRLAHSHAQFLHMMDQFTQEYE